MTSSLLIALNVALDLGILGALTLVMSRPARLTPHRSHADVSAARD